MGSGIGSPTLTMGHHYHGRSPGSSASSSTSSHIAYSPLSNSSSSSPSSTGRFFCWSRSTCYKSLLGVVVVFMIMQLLVDFSVYTSRFNLPTISGISGWAAGNIAGGGSSGKGGPIPGRFALPMVGTLPHGIPSDAKTTRRKDTSDKSNHSNSPSFSPVIHSINNSKNTVQTGSGSGPVTTTTSSSGGSGPLNGSRDKPSQTGSPSIVPFAISKASDSSSNVISADDKLIQDYPDAALNLSLADLYETQPPPLVTCPKAPPTLVGRLKVLYESPSMLDMERELDWVEAGGRYRPANCVARHKVAIIIPYRDRAEHLQTFLYNLHPVLKRQQIDYGIYVVEQYGHARFNRAKLMNVGYLEALKQYDYECFIFHDVDLIPEDDRNLYTCPRPNEPRHMSVAVDKFKYKLPYKDIFGGVSALTREQMVKVNGFSNEFWGWGGEDDDMSNRIRYHNLRIDRYPSSIARYVMLKHKGDTPNPDRYKQLGKAKKMYKTDGINSTHYKVVDLLLRKLYTWILVEVYPPA